MTRKSLLLAFWTLGILFPMAWFTRFSATYDRLFNYVFGPPWTHVVMHTFLFAVLSYLLVPVIACRPAAHSRGFLVGVVLALVMGVAILQESIQLLYMAQMPGVDEMLDLGVDLLGGGLGVIVAQWRAWRGGK